MTMGYPLPTRSIALLCLMVSLLGATHGATTVELRMNDVRIRIKFPATQEIDTIRLAAAPSLPGTLAVSGRDERLAFHNFAVIAYVSMTSGKVVQMTGPPTLSFTLPQDGSANAQYFLAYLAPDSESWVAPIDNATSRAGRSRTMSVSFATNRLPTVLLPGRIYHFVLYRPKADTIGSSALALNTVGETTVSRPKL